MLKAARLFGTNGIRAVAGTILNADFAYRIGSSVTSLFEDRRILVGCDGRTSSPMVTEGVVAGILAHGNDVEDCGQSTTPGLQFLVKLARDESGVMSSAKHYPAEY